MTADEQTIQLPLALLERWRRFQQAHPTWELNDFVRQLLEQHFNEAEQISEGMALEAALYYYRQEKKIQSFPGGASRLSRILARDH